MSKFLKEVAACLIEKHKTDLDKVTVIFPNRRAGLFFQKYLSELIEKPQFSPDITTISEFVSQLSTIRLADQNALIVELYSVFKQLTKSTETLDDFFYWGEMMLSDFNDIDKYLIDARQLFNNIESLREIDAGFDFLTPEQMAYIAAFWANILNSRGSENKDQFLSIWKNLYEIYLRFNARLVEKGMAYEGLVYRKMTESLSNQTTIDKSRNFVIIGFNALNECELKLFDFLKINATTDFFWDYDEYYLENEHHEAAMFMRSNLSKFPMPNDFSVSFDNFKKQTHIDVVAVPGFSGQATMAATWLNKNKEKVNAKFDNTALVLCDENLLMPMLNTIPEDVSELNITMGYPVKGSPAFALLRSLIDIDKNARKDKVGTNVFYFRNVLSLLNNSLIKMNLREVVDQLYSDIQKENKIYLCLNDFKQNSFLTFLFDLPVDAQSCKEYLQKILIHIFKETSEEEKLLKETIYQLYLAINRMHDSIFSLNNSEEFPITKRLYYQLLLRQLDRLTIPFEGEPLSGMQLMGFLETRCLDFDNLILLSLNDDRLPGNPHQHSFIPYSLRKGFGLPVIEQRNAMYSYYFYRLIQRAKQVTLVYDSRTEGMSNGEVSRFVTQLKFEAAHLKINEQQAKFNFEPSENQVISIDKSANLQVKLETHLETKRISPSALNTYLECKLKFYFKYIEKIHEADEVMEEIDHLLFGRIAHLSLEELYLPFIGKEISEETVQQLLQSKTLIDKSLKNALQKEFFKKGNFDLSGSNLLVYDIIKKYVVRVLNYDKSIAPFLLIGLEQEYESTIEIDAPNKKLVVRYGGIVDRIDQVGDIIRVVDYKTGKAENGVASIDKLFEPKQTRNKAAFQTMLYSSCVYNKLKPNLPLMPAVYGAQGIFTAEFDPTFSFQGGKLIYQANADEFNHGLKVLFEELVNTDIPFSQTANIQSCSYCEYNLICNRQG